LVRCVFDTNVLVSALLSPESTSRKAFDLARESGVVVLSPSVIAELRDVLKRRKVRRYVDEDHAQLWLAVLIRQSALIDDPSEVVECRDPKDEKFLALAIGGHATHIVSGDADLLVLDPFRGIRIVTPRQFLVLAI
jgi:putative PIN family toxin of toxin-antitoxin system